MNPKSYVLEDMIMHARGIRNKVNVTWNEIKVGILLRLEAEKSLSKFNCPKQDKLLEYKAIFTFHFQTSIQNHRQTCPLLHYLVFLLYDYKYLRQESILDELKTFIFY